MCQFGLACVPLVVRLHYAALARVWSAPATIYVNGFRIAAHSTNTYGTHIRIIFCVVGRHLSRCSPLHAPIPATFHPIECVRMRFAVESVGRGHAVASTYPLFRYSEKKFTYWKSGKQLLCCWLSLALSARARAVLPAVVRPLMLQLLLPSHALASARTFESVQLNIIDDT